MPKVYLTVLLSLFSGIALYAQSGMLREVIGATGNNSTNGNLSVSWTLGEISIESYAQDILSLLQGFHNINDPITSTINAPKLLCDVTVYPVPTQGEITIDAITDQSLVLELIDLQGRVLFTQQLSSLVVPHTISIQQFPAASYILRISDEYGRFSYFKIQKI